MCEIWTTGELLCEIVRPHNDMPLDKPNIFRGPYPSGAPAIFIDTVAKLKHRCGIIGTIGNDDFGRCIINRLLKDGVNCEHVRIDPLLSTGVAFVSYDSQGERKFIYHIGNAASDNIILPTTLPQKVSVFHVMGCALMPSKQMADSVVQATIHYYDCNATISFDPNIRTEAGDVFDASFICSYFDRKSFKKCARIASAAAALNTAAFGPMEGDITAENILTLMNEASKNSMLKPIAVERSHNADEST